MTPEPRLTTEESSEEILGQRTATLHPLGRGDVHRAAGRVVLPRSTQIRSDGGSCASPPFSCQNGEALTCSVFGGLTGTVITPVPHGAQATRATIRSNPAERPVTRPRACRPPPAPSPPPTGGA